MISKHKSITVDTKNIIYLQAENKSCYIVTTTGHFTLPRSLAVLTDELPVSDFFRIHRSVTVNMHYIKSFSENSVILENGLTLPISRYKYNDFLEAFSNHMSHIVNNKSSV